VKKSIFDANYLIYKIPSKNFLTLFYNEKSLKLLNMKVLNFLLKNAKFSLTS